MKHIPAQPRTFLFLQGPPGPFFERLGATLAAAGHGVHRINLNGGDRRSWPQGATDYRGSPERWPRFFEDFVKANAVTDLVLFGDCRPLHSAAHGIAKLNHLRIHVFEEGYIRPDWVTLELDGVNGNSTLSKDPDWYLAAARGLPPLPTYPGVASSFRRRAGEAVSYYTHGVLQTWRFPHYRSHREGKVIVEGLGWLKRLGNNGKARERAARILAGIGERPYFVFPLQLNSDHQIRIHSPFGNMRVAMDYVIQSFARAAPADVALVIKQHPLDNGLVNWRKQALASAKRLGLDDRLLFLEDGDVAKIVDRARGVVTINSTTGTLSLGVGVPTIVLGHAVYDIPGITHQGPLDEFWQRPVPPHPPIWDAFCRVLLDRCLIRGGFLSEEGLELLIAGSVRRLTRRALFDAETVEPSIKIR